MHNTIKRCVGGVWRGGQSTGQTRGERQVLGLRMYNTKYNSKGVASNSQFNMYYIKWAYVHRNRLGFYSCTSCILVLRRIVNWS